MIIISRSVISHEIVWAVGTFKHVKTNLVAEGYDPRAVGDPLYFFNGQTYESLTPDLYDAIISGRIRV